MTCASLEGLLSLSLSLIAIAAAATSPDGGNDVEPVDSANPPGAHAGNGAVADKRDPPAPFDSRVLSESYGVRRPDEALKVELTSRLAVEAEALIEVVAVDETQATKTLISLGTVGRSATVVLDIPLSRLPAPRRALRVAGVLSLHTLLRLPENGPILPDEDGPVLVSYHPEAQGLRIYDEETRPRDFHGGVLDPTPVASLAARDPSGCELLGAAEAARLAAQLPRRDKRT